MGEVGWRIGADDTDVRSTLEYTYGVKSHRYLESQGNHWLGTIKESVSLVGREHSVSLRDIGSNKTALCAINAKFDRTNQLHDF